MEKKQRKYWNEKEKDKVKMNPTDIVRNIKAIGEATSWAMRWEINAIRIRVCSGRGGKVVVVAIVNQRVSKDEESPPRLGLGS